MLVRWKRTLMGLPSIEEQNEFYVARVWTASLGRRNSFT